MPELLERALIGLRGGNSRGVLVPGMTRTTACGVAAAVVAAFLVAFFATGTTAHRAGPPQADVGRAAQGGSREAAPPAAPRLNDVAPLPALAVRVRRRARRSAAAAHRRPAAEPRVATTKSVQEDPPPLPQTPKASPPPPAARPAPRITPPRPTPAPTSDSQWETFDSSD